MSGKVIKTAIKTTINKTSMTLSLLQTHSLHLKNSPKDLNRGRCPKSKLMMLTMTNLSSRSGRMMINSYRPWLSRSRSSRTQSQSQTAASTSAPTSAKRRPLR